MESVDGLSTRLVARSEIVRGAFVDVAARDVPEQWAEWLVKAGLVDPRNGEPSMTQLAEASGVHASTIGAMMYGTRKPTAEKVDAVADALSNALRLKADDQRDAMRQTIHRLVGRALKIAAPFSPHPDADLLDDKERKAVNELIRLLALSKKAGQGDASVTHLKQAGVSDHAELGRKLKSGRAAARGKGADASE